MNLLTERAQVERVLEAVPEARSDDARLVEEVVMRYRGRLFCFESLGFAPRDVRTFVRMRNWIQKERPELKASDKTQAFRAACREDARENFGRGVIE